MVLTQQEIIEELKKEIEKLKISRSLDSKISSKPPSSDLLKKPERKEKSESKKPKRSPGVIISDDFSVYNGYSVAAQQKCQAHLRRHCQRLIKTPGQDNQLIGLTLTEIVDEAFRQHRLWRENNQQQDYLDWAAQFKTKVDLILSEWIKKAGYEAGKILLNLKLKAAQWWYFLDHPDVPPDNNLAERALRLAVTKRKVSGGSRTRARFQETANLLSVIQS